MGKPSRIIDVHQHVSWHGRDDRELLANLDEHGIDRAVLLNWDVTPLEAYQGYEAAFNPVHTTPGGVSCGLPLADIVAAARRHPERFVVGYCPHPLDPYAVEHLDAAVRMHDVRICGEWKAALLLDDPRCINLFRYCGEQHLPVLVHLDVPYRPTVAGEKPEYCREWYGGTPDNLERALAACPETVFIGHGPGFWRHVSGDEAAAGGGYPDGPVAPGGRVPELLDACEKLHAELSANSALNALKRDPDFGKAFLLKHHEKILFGRDAYSGDLHAYLQSLDLPDDVTENIYHRNAEKLLRGEI